MELVALSQNALNLSGNDELNAYKIEVMIRRDQYTQLLLRDKENEIELIKKRKRDVEEELATSENRVKKMKIRSNALQYLPKHQVPVALVNIIRDTDRSDEEMCSILRFIALGVQCEYIVSTGEYWRTNMLGMIHLASSYPELVLTENDITRLKIVTKPSSLSDVMKYVAVRCGYALLADLGLIGTPIEIPMIPSMVSAQMDDLITFSNTKHTAYISGSPIDGFNGSGRLLEKMSEDSENFPKSIDYLNVIFSHTRYPIVSDMFTTTCNGRIKMCERKAGCHGPESRWTFDEQNVTSIYVKNLLEKRKNALSHTQSENITLELKLVKSYRKSNYTGFRPEGMSKMCETLGSCCVRCHASLMTISAFPKKITSAFFVDNAMEVITDNNEI